MPNKNHDPKTGEFSDGSGSNSILAHHGTPTEYVQHGGRSFAYLTKDSGPPPKAGESYGERNTRLAMAAVDQGKVPPNVVGRDARRLFQQVMAKAQRENPKYFVPKGGKAFTPPKTKPSPLAFTGASDALSRLPAGDPALRNLRALGLGRALPVTHVHHNPGESRRRK